ncbi:MAG TPA: PDZ domain-containing protein [Pyrinomonadaceae bacterium]|nr:PDZ domain-containing protein [Pyrinomonadaceae bacterium]
MKAKYSIGFLVALILTTGLALAQQPKTPPEPPEPPDEPFTNTFSLFTDGGYLGVYAENINRENMARYHMSQPRGVGITQVVQGSPAEKAGLRKDDVILRLDGENITSVRKLNRLVSEIAPDQSVRVTVSRNGAEQELTATVGKRNNFGFAQDLFSNNGKTFKLEPKTWKFEYPNIDRFELGDHDFGDLTMILGNGRRLGVSTMQLNKQLADYFGVAKGVLVTAVSEDGPSAKAGVRAGDVITAIDGEEVDSPGDLSRVANNKKDGDVTLTIIRNKSQQTIRVTPRQGGFSTAPGRPQMGRRIVIPRIEIPVMPDIEIEMPQIRIPSVPAVDVKMRPMRIRTPRIKISRPVRGPI